jgi:hypothetical protein
MSQKICPFDYACAMLDTTEGTSADGGMMDARYIGNTLSCSKGRPQHGLLGGMKMKKPTRIILATVGIVCGIFFLAVVAGLIGTALFPGLPAYLTSRVTFKHIEVHLVDYPGNAVPEATGQVIASNGFSITMPSTFKETTKTDTVDIFEDVSKGMAIALQLDRLNISVDGPAILNPDNASTFTNEFSKNFGNYPDTLFAMNRLFLSFSIRDFNLRDSGQCRLMTALAVEKELVIGAGEWTDAYWFEQGDIQGILMTNSPALYNFQFIKKSEPNLEYQISFLRQIDLPTVYSVINSIQWNENLDGEPTPTPGNGQIG